MRHVLGILLLLPASAGAQSILNSSGGSLALAGNTFEWSIGEMTVVNTASPSGLVVTQGLLQPFYGYTGIEESPLSGNLSVYPNPTTETVWLKPELNGGGKLTILLTDLSGRQLSAKEISLVSGLEQQQIPMNSYVPGCYLLFVTFSQGNTVHSASYKIQKL